MMAGASIFPVKRERQILFSAPMVRAILDGRKTQTRRIAKPRFDDRKPCEHWKGENHDGDATMYRHCSHGSEGLGCPYGQPGDRLWVRETWFSSNPKTPSRVRYAADDLIRLEDGLFARAVCNPPKWRPSLFMPRWASRITLEIVAVRVERLQDISDTDAIREGIPDYPDFTGDSPVHDYSALWESINGNGSWDLNPWVWVIEFKRVTT